MKKKDILNAGIQLVVSVGVGAIVSNAVAFTTPVLAVGVLKKACIGVGSFVLSSMLSDKATDYACDKVDEVLTEVKKLKEEDEETDVKKKAESD